ncbi:hypothetical protein RRSWK_05659 [Rhodopirellula sp. SWK7]|nr:hypothetical protein RRSWK_05659 [Rhodopirellula sp. SWK7]
MISAGKTRVETAFESISEDAASVQSRQIHQDSLPRILAASMLFRQTL